MSDKESGQQPRFGPGEGAGYMLAVAVGAYATAGLLYVALGLAPLPSLVGVVVGTVAGVATGIVATRRLRDGARPVSGRSPVTFGLVAAAAGVASLARGSATLLAFVLIAGTTWFGGLSIAMLIWTLRVRRRGTTHPSRPSP